MPPIEPPMTASSFCMPKWSISLFCAFTVSPIVTVGKSVPYGLPVFGLVEDGPVEPLQPPITLEQIIKYLFVSKPLPGPIKLSHQPVVPAACASPERAWRTSMAFCFCLLSFPYVS